MARRNMTDLISIGMPVRNGAATLGIALDSVINQSYSNIEIIISNNNSDDETDAVCQRYLDMDHRIKYFKHNKTKTANDNFRFVLEKSRGKYFMWAAHDDARSENYIETLLTGFDKYPSASIVFTDAIIFEDHNDLKNDIMLSQMNHCMGGFESINLSFINKHKKQKDDTCLHIYGLINPVYLTDYPWFEIEFGSDRPLLHWLLTHGDFVYVPRAQFYYFQKIKSLDDVALSISFHKMRPYPCVRFSWICARSVKMASKNACVTERLNIFYLFVTFYIQHYGGMINLMKTFLYRISPTWLRLIWGRIKSKEALDEK